MIKVSIIGAGASGLLLSNKLSQQPNVQVYLFEKGKNVGAKLRASGGGKANIFNKDVTPTAYNHADFMKEVLRQVSPESLYAEFESLGLRMLTDSEGRVYPYSESSQTMIDVLWNPARPNVHTLTTYEVRSITPVDGQWQINDYPVRFDVVALASGSPANMIPTNQQNYNGYLRSLDLNMQPLIPSLVGFKIKNYDRRLSGCRVKVKASLLQNERFVYAEQGEVTFKEDGLSGIVILNLSAYYNRLPAKNNCSIELDFLYDEVAFDVQTYLEKFGSLKGLLHPKLVALYERTPFDLHHFRMNIEETYTLLSAQVCHGGIDLSEVTPNMRLKRFPNLYAMGEMLDVDGICGGFNLFFAFASALIVAKAIAAGPH